MKEWITSAAKELASHFSFGCGPDSYVTDEQRQNVADNYASIIVKYVPRCETCRYWASHTGECTAISINAPKMPRGSLLLITTADFGCVRWKGKQ